MNLSEEISRRCWNQPDKGEREHDRENQFIDDIVQKTHIQREILSHLDGVKTVFDGGAGAGRFSILLAKRGLSVTHFDISKSMIAKARQLAEEAGVLKNIEFVEGSLVDLSGFAGRKFDMVLSFDAPISYTYPHQEQVIAGLVGLARKKVLFSVSSRLGSLPYWSNPNQKSQFFLQRDTSNDPWVRWCVEHEKELTDNFVFNGGFCGKILDTGLYDDFAQTQSSYDRGESPWPITYLFMPDELTRILTENGVKNIRLAGPGAFARTIPNEILIKIFQNEKQRYDFLDFCYRFDSNPYVCGLGKDNLLAVGDV